MVVLRRVAVGVLVAGLSGLASGLVSGGAWAAASFLTPQQVDLMTLLAPPPVAGAEVDRAEMAEVVGLEQSRSAVRAARARADADESVYDMFGALLGPGFKKEAMPLADALFERLAETEEEVVGAAKTGFGRPRPFHVNAGLHPVAPMSKSGSYPSGHATRVTIMGLVMARMVPERRGEIFARMAEYAESRVIAGVHYRSDIEAGRIAGTAVDAVLFNDAGFMAAFGGARGEVRRGLGLAP